MSAILWRMYQPQDHRKKDVNVKITSSALVATAYDIDTTQSYIGQYNAAKSKAQKDNSILFLDESSVFFLETNHGLNQDSMNAIAGIISTA